MGKLKVIKAGVLSTVQDRGRFGYRRYGIPQSGAMDQSAMRNANELVGNQENSPIIETAIQGLELEAIEESTVALTGAEVLAKINGRQISMNTSYKLEIEDKLSISPPLKGVYSYLAIGGELIAKEDFKSKSTYLMAGFGGIDGRALKAGDLLETENGTLFQRRSIEADQSNTDIQVIRMIRGPEWGKLKDLPERRTFKIDPSSNRMGIRLQGDVLGVDGREIVSSAVVPGTIQLPADGLPIVLMNDCQTTGGYPRIGKVIDEDLGRLAQVRAGQKIRFILTEIS